MATKRREYNYDVIELRQELTALIKWEKSNFPCVTKMETDAVAHRILRMAELIRRIRDLADRN